MHYLQYSFALIAASTIPSAQSMSFDCDASTNDVRNCNLTYVQEQHLCHSDSFCNQESEINYRIGIASAQFKYPLWAERPNGVWQSFMN